MKERTEINDDSGSLEKPFSLILSKRLTSRLSGSGQQAERQERASKP